MSEAVAHSDAAIALGFDARDDMNADQAIAWAGFQLAARNLKSAEGAFRAAQQAYAEAVKRLSEAAAP